MRRWVCRWKLFRRFCQSRSFKKQPGPQLGKAMVRVIFGGTFLEVPPYTYVVLLFFSSRKQCGFKANKMLQKYHSGRGKAVSPLRMGVVGVRFSSNSRQEAALLRVVVFTIFKQLYGGTTMKKLLMCSAAIALGLAVAAPAKADGIKLDLAGHFKGYLTWLSQDTIPGTNERHFDILRETEIHFTGETTLDNGLTVGVHHEADIDNQTANTTTTTTTDSAGDTTTTINRPGADFFVTEESYAYFSGAWGRVNFGKEDGANYLLQVAAPSADENFDGLRQYINPLNNQNIGNRLYAIAAAFAPVTGQVGGMGARGFINTGKLDYSNDASGYSNKLTYLTPVFSGFQAGVSYTPTSGGVQIGGSPSGTDGSKAFGVSLSNDGLNHDVYGSAWEGAVRYEGKWQELGLNLGGGYSHVGLQQSFDGPVGPGFIPGGLGSNVDAFNQWNLGAALTCQQFGLGVVYTKDNGGLNTDGENKTWVVGVDYTTGPFKIGGSYLNNHEELGEIATGAGANVSTDIGTLDTNRWAGGVVYTYGPGMTFRGSAGWGRSNIPDNLGGGDVKATDILLGTQINF